MEDGHKIRFADQAAVFILVDPARSGKMETVGGPLFQPNLLLYP